MGRQAHGRPLQAAGPSRPAKRKPAKGQALNALQTAEHEFPFDAKVRQHRLGQLDDDPDEPSTRADADNRSSKRRKVANEQEETDEVDEGSDLEGNQWHVGVDDEDDDSDIDSEDAFGESDEEKFAGFTFRGSEEKSSGVKRKNSVKKKPTQSVNLSEMSDASDDFEQFEDDQSSADEDDLGEEAVDLATAFDMNEEEDRREVDKSRTKVRASAGKTRSNTRILEGQEEEDSEETEETDDDEGGSQLSISDDEEEGDHIKLRSFVESMDPARKTEKNQRTHQPKALPDKPSGFGLGASNISAADLMQYIKDPTQRQSLKILESGAKEEASNYKGGIPGKLAAPLAKRQQDRLDRVVAYEKSKETLGRWIDTVKQNRRAEHLAFPLPDQALQSALGKRSFEPTLTSAPQTELESKIQEIMQESGLIGKSEMSTEEQELAFEALQEKKIPIEEVQARRAQLRAQRELMFREEIRARRIKKIKSKAYRRVHRKEKDRNETHERERLAAAGLLNSDDDRERDDRRRAEERMGARHRESKWAKAVKSTGKGKWDEDARAGVSDLARRDDELRRRIEGKHVRTSDASDDESDSEYDEADDSEDDLRTMTKKIKAMQETVDDVPKSGLASMAFMQRAERARKLQNEEEIKQLQRSLGEREPNESEDEDDEAEEFGRQKFGATGPEQVNSATSRQLRNELEARLSEDEDDGDSTELVQKHDRASTSTGFAPQIPRDSKNSSVRAASKGSSRAAASGDLISVKTARPLSVTNRSHEQALDRDTSPSDSEDEPIRDEQDLKLMDVFGEDFAGDDETTQQFKKDKQEAIAEEGDQIVDNTLPGWGNWAGAGVSKRETKKGKGRFLTTVKGIAPEDRKDAKLDRVIINEKRVKKNGKYLATELPHPFESRAQYERSLRLPMGPEWSTRNHFQDSIKPRVLVKQGTVIKPMARPLAG